MPGPPEQRPVSARWSLNSSQVGRSFQVNVIPPCSYRLVLILTQWLPNTESARNVNKRHFDLVHLFLLTMYCIILPSLWSGEKCFALTYHSCSIIYVLCHTGLLLFTAPSFWVGYFSSCCMLYICLNTLWGFLYFLYKRLRFVDSCWHSHLNSCRIYFLLYG